MDDHSPHTADPITGLPMRWIDEGGLVHACEGAQATPDNKNFLVFTLCKIDVPPGQAVVTDAAGLQVTCPKCSEKLHE